MASSRALAEALLERQLIPPEEIDGLLVREQSEQQSLAQILIAEGRLSQKQLADAHAGQLGVMFWDFSRSGWRPELAALVPRDVMVASRALPVEMREDGALIVAIDEPAAMQALDSLANMTGRQCVPALADPDELGAAITQAMQSAPAAESVHDPLAAANESFAVAAEHEPASDFSLPTEQPAAPQDAGPVSLGRSEAEIPDIGGLEGGLDAGPASRAGGNGGASQIQAEMERASEASSGGLIDMPELLESKAGEDQRKDNVVFDLHVNDLLERTLDDGASDLHLSAGSPPQIRVNGELEKLDEFGMLEPQELRRMIYGILTQKQRETLESEWELDLSHPLPGKGRFRVNIFFQRESIGAVMRAIPDQVVPLEMLGLPRVVRDFAEYPRGLVLITGPTGSGKSTTLASLIDIINDERPCHIMTVEDPIEFLHRHKRAIVNQRELGQDTRGFANALKHVLRQDPDVILVGEMRDLETISTALTAAETGHLVFATLHTQDAPQSIDRMIDVFPSHQQDQVRVQLATTLQAIMTQQLIRSGDGSCRYVGTEVMVATPAIRNLIREGKIYQIYSAMQAGGQHGMQTMDQSLAEMVKHGKIPYDLALERCANQNDLARLCGRM